ncbi:MAG: glycosyltransferase family 4 protein, partial [bacterium]
PQPWRYTRMLNAALRHVDAFIAPSEFVMHRHLAAGLDIPIVHIPPALGESIEDPSMLPPAQTVGLPDRPYFLFVGRLEKLKGLQTVIPLFRNYTEADLVIAGDGDFEMELRRLAAGCPRIHFLGRLSSAQLRVAYARAVALLVPSITYETFGQVIIEAFAARTPVIVRDLGALPEVVAESGGGQVFKTEAELLQAMERLRVDGDLRNRLGEAGYRAYRARWTEEVHVERYLSLIDDIAARKRASTGSIEPHQEHGGVRALRAQ